VQQIDTPMALYRRPANLFVAGFLGSPGMNLLQGRLDRNDGLGLMLDGGGRLPLAPAVVVPEGWLGRAIVLGVRPESLQPQADALPGVEALVEAVEPVGNECFVNLTLAGQPLVLRCPPVDLPEPGQRWRLAAVADVHFFDPATGERLEATGLG
jgi:multiple sugar transport system ATP-binding protein